MRKLYGDPYIKNRKGIFEFILGGSVDTKLLEVRIFDEATKRSAYESQTVKAKKKKNQIVLSVSSAMMRTKEKFGVLAKWKQTMYQRGARAELLQRRIARCFAKHTIGRKEIVKILEEIKKEI